MKSRTSTTTSGYRIIRHSQGFPELNSQDQSFIPSIQSVKNNRTSYMMRTLSRPDLRSSQILHNQSEYDEIPGSEALSTMNFALNPVRFFTIMLTCLFLSKYIR